MDYLVDRKEIPLSKTSARRATPVLSKPSSRVPARSTLEPVPFKPPPEPARPSP